MSGITKYIPITESEYKKYREEQQNRVKLAQDELARPNAIVTLANAQDEKAHTLFNDTGNAELQELRYKQLFNIVNELKNQIEKQTKFISSSSLHKPLQKIKSNSEHSKAERLFESLDKPIVELKKKNSVDFSTLKRRKKYNSKKKNSSNVSFNAPGNKTRKSVIGFAPKSKKKDNVKLGEEILNDTKKFRKFINAL